MKILVLIFIVLLVVICFRFFNKINKKSNLEKKKEEIIDLEKDPKTDEYKPKE